MPITWIDKRTDLRAQTIIQSFISNPVQDEAETSPHKNNVNLPVFDYNPLTNASSIFFTHKSKQHCLLRLVRNQSLCQWLSGKSQLFLSIITRYWPLQTLEWCLFLILRSFINSLILSVHCRKFLKYLGSVSLYLSVSPYIKTHAFPLPHITNLTKEKPKLLVCIKTVRTRRDNCTK